jgi:hypothetical protein
MELKGEASGISSYRSTLKGAVPHTAAALQLDSVDTALYLLTNSSMFQLQFKYFHVQNNVKKNGL